MNKELMISDKVIKMTSEAEQVLKKIFDKYIHRKASCKL